LSQTHCKKKIDVNEILKDKDIQRICFKASSSFSECLSKDEIENCIYNATWSASLNYNPDRNTKFATYLYRGVVNECIKCKKFTKKHKANHVPINSNILSSNFKPFEKIELIEEIKTCSEPDILIDKFFYNLTLNEIALKKGISKETVRFKLKKNLDFLKNRFSKVYNI
jgi:hypothetical protein